MNHLAEAEYRFACLVWDNEPLPSGQLVKLSAAELGWKKSTTYTVVDKTFDGSLPRFVAAFLNSKPISAAEAAEIRALLDAAQSKEG